MSPPTAKEITRQSVGMVVAVRVGGRHLISQFDVIFQVRRWYVHRHCHFSLGQMMTTIVMMRPLLPNRVSSGSFLTARFVSSSAFRNSHVLGLFSPTAMFKDKHVSMVERRTD